MTATQKQAVVDRILDAFRERTQWSRWYRKNACAVHGVEYDGDDPQPIELTIKDERPSSGTGGQANSQTGTPAADQPSGLGFIEQAKQSKWLMPLVTAAAIATGAGGAWAFNKFFGQPDNPVVIQQPGDSSLLQELEDRGLHLSRGNE